LNLRGDISLCHRGLNFVARLILPIVSWLLRNFLTNAKFIIILQTYQSIICLAEAKKLVWD